MNEILLIMLGFLSAAFFAGTETAFVTSFYSSSEKKYVEKWRSAPEKLLALTLIGTNISIVLADSVAIEYVINRFGELAEIWTTLIVTFIVLIFCEVLPKSVAIKSPNIWVRFSTPLLYLSYVIMYPVVVVMTLFAKTITKVLDAIGKNDSEEKAYYYEFFRKPVEGLDCGRQSVLLSLLRLGGKSVHEIAFNIADLPSVEVTEPIESVWKYIIEGAPYVVVVDSGNVLGVYDREIAGRVYRGVSAGAGCFSRLFVPELKSSELFLSESAGSDFPPAIVIDEYGVPTGVTGGLPMIEKFVRCEDFSSKSPSRRTESHIFSADVPVEVLESIISEPLPRGQFRTLGGLIEELANEIPKPGQKVEWGSFEFVVVSSDERKIYKVRVVRKEEI